MGGWGVTLWVGLVGGVIGEIERECEATIIGQRAGAGLWRKHNKGGGQDKGGDKKQLREMRLVV